jgi:hypothetical protein
MLARHVLTCTVKIIDVCCYCGTRKPTGPKAMQIHMAGCLKNPAVIKRRETLEEFRRAEEESARERNAIILRQEERKSALIADPRVYYPEPVIFIRPEGIELFLYPGPGGQTGCLIGERDLPWIAERKEVEKRGYARSWTRYYPWLPVDDIDRMFFDKKIAIGTVKDETCYIEFDFGGDGGAHVVWNTLTIILRPRERTFDVMETYDDT